MTNAAPETTASPEVTPEERAIERYAELLLIDPDGNERVAIAEHILAADAEPGSKTAQARFYKKDGGYFIEEFRDGEARPVFIEYMVPVSSMYEAGDIPEGAKWATGMERCRWARFSIHEFDNIKPIIGVLKAFFGKLPK